MCLQNKHIVSSYEQYVNAMRPHPSHTEEVSVAPPRLTEYKRAKLQVSHSQRNSPQEPTWGPQDLHPHYGSPA